MRTTVDVQKMATGCIVGFVSLVGGMAGFFESRLSVLGASVDTKLDRFEDKMDKKLGKMMKILLVLAQDVAFVKGAISNKK